MTRWTNMNGKPDCINMIIKSDSTSMVMAPDSTTVTPFKMPKELKEPKPLAIGFSGGSVIDRNGETCQANGGNSSYLTAKSKSESESLSVIPTQSSSATTSSFTPSNWVPTSTYNSTNSNIPGDVGLTNLGNTCFLNSGLQCLLHSGGLVEYFLTCRSMDAPGSIVSSLLHAFQIVTQQAWSGQLDTIPLHDFRTVLGGIHPQFKDGRQHDCQEFLALTLDSLHEQLKKWKSEEDSPAEAKDHLICDETMECVNNDEWTESKPQVGVHSNCAEIDSEFDDCQEVSSSTGPSANSKVDTDTIIQKSIPTKSKSLGRKNFKGIYEPHKNVISQTRQSANFALAYASPLNEMKNQSLETQNMQSLLMKAPEDATIRNSAKNNRKKSKPEQRYDEELNTKKIKMDKIADVNAENSYIANGHAEEDPNSPIECDEDEETTKPTQISGGSNLKELKEKVDDYWSKHIAENNTVISSTFQGVYKSTVICSTCFYVSITYEPFMYLSLPIPRITTKELKVKVINMRITASVGLSGPTDLVLTLNLTDNVAKFKEEVLKRISREGDCSTIDNLFAAEVANNCVARSLDDNILLREINDSSRNIYIYELNDNFNSCDYGFNYDAFPNYYTEPVPSNVHLRAELLGKTFVEEEDWDAPPRVSTVEQEILPGEKLPSFNGDDTLTNMDESGVDSLKENNEILKTGAMCCICLESEPASEFRKHNRCGCIICKDCIQRGAQHLAASIENTHGPLGINYIKCPHCMTIVEHEKEYVEYVPFATIVDTISQRMQLICINFRCDSDSNNNSASTRLFGSPLIARIPNSLPVVEFNHFISQFSLFPNLEFKVVCVTGDGTRCGFCVFGDECPGCDLIVRDGIVFLSAVNTIALCYSNLTEEDIASVEPVDMMKGLGFSQLYSAGPWLSTGSSDPQVDIYECLGTFSESENLDEQNGWFCPQCNKNQCATKSMNVCKFPDYLIVYLKRFVFIDNSSIKLNNKLSFPLTDLDLKPYISKESAENQCLYDLYACVCHFGSASAGHYTAYGKNPVTNSWNYFNDSQVTRQTPGENDFGYAYVLFYQRKGVTCNIPGPEKIRVSKFVTQPRVACVVPCGKSVNFATNTKKSPDSQGVAVHGCDKRDHRDEIQFSVTSSTTTNPISNSCDSSKRVKIDSNTPNCPNGFLEDEDQENHLPVAKLENGLQGCGDCPPEGPLLALGRKGKRTVQTVNGDDSTIDS